MSVAVSIPAAAGNWSSEHVFISPGTMSDLFLVRVVAPFLRTRSGVRKWFFIRYGEGGPHLRIRIEAEDPEVAEAARRRWQEAAPGYLDGTVPGPEWSTGTETAFEPGSVQRIDYEPELERYGGARVMAANERLFCRSTTLALGIIGATLDSFERRIGQAAKMMVAGAGALTDDRERIGEMFRNYAAGWERFLTPFGWRPDARPLTLRDPDVEAWLGEAASGERSYSTVWRASVDDLVAELAAEDNQPLTARPSDIVFSQIHMLCNRLGVSPSMEFHLASQIGNSL